MRPPDDLLPESEVVAELRAFANAVKLPPADEVECADWALLAARAPTHKALIGAANFARRTFVDCPDDPAFAVRSLGIVAVLLTKAALVASDLASLDEAHDLG